MRTCHTTVEGASILRGALGKALRDSGFDDFVEPLCEAFYHQRLGRPSIVPGIYFWCLLIGYFEGIDSERGIAWRCPDSLSLRQFLGIALDDSVPDHSNISRTRRLLSLQVHQQVFQWVLALLGSEGLVKGKTVGVDASTLEANAAMRSIVRRDTGEGYDEFLTGLAKASGIDTPTREDLVKLDKKRKKKTSNDDWHNPNDPDAKVAKMKDGRTHMAHKAEHAVDMDTGTVLGVDGAGRQRRRHDDLAPDRRADMRERPRRSAVRAGGRADRGRTDTGNRSRRQ